MNYFNNKTRGNQIELNPILQHKDQTTKPMQ